MIVSDFISRAGLGAPAGALARRHDVVAIQVVDRREFELPAAGMIYVEDAETGEQIFVDTDDPAFQQRLRAAADERQAALLGGRALGRASTCSPVATDDDLVRALARISELRRRRTAAMTLRVALDARSRSRAVPLLVLWLPAAAAAPRGAARRAGRARPGRPGAPSPAGGGTSPPALLLAALALLLVALARPAGDRAEPRREGTVILAFDVSTSMAANDLAPDPAGRREGRGPRVRRAAAGDRPGRRRGVRRQRARHPAAHHRPGERARRDRPPDPAGRHGARRAACRRRSAPSPGSRAASTRPDGSGRAARARTSATTARRRSSCSPTARTPPSPTRSTCRARVDRRGAGLPDRAGQPARARCSRSTASRSPPRWTRPTAARDRRPTDGRYFAAADEQALASVYDVDRPGLDRRGRARRGHRPARRRGRAAAAGAAPGSRWRGSGGWCSDGLRLAARPAGPARRARCWSRLPVAAAAAAPAARCGTPASR